MVNGSKVKFIKSIISEQLVIFKRKKIDITADLKMMNLYENPEYDYLLNMPVQTFTEEKIAKLEKDLKDKEEEYNIIKNTTIKDIWIKDLKKIN